MADDVNCLVGILTRYRSQIAAVWRNLILGLPDSHYQSITQEDILASCYSGIDTLLELLDHGSEFGVEQYIKQISFKRLEQGFDIREVIQALLLLHRAVVLVAMRDTTISIDQTIQAYLDLGDGLRLIVSRFGYLYSTAMNRTLEAQQQQARSLAQENARLYQETRQRLIESLSLQRVTSALLQGRTLEEIFNVVSSEAINLIGARGSTIFLLENDIFLRVAYSLGDCVPAFETMPVAESFTGLVITGGKAVYTNSPDQEVNWYRRTIDRGTTGDIHSLLAVPLIVRATNIGVLVVVNKDAPFDEDDLRVMGLFADQAAIAIENGRLIQEVERIAVMEERNRLARDLHDSITQSLYGVTLYAEATTRRLALEDYRGVDENLQQLKKTASDALKEMRLLIFELRPPVLEKEGLEAALQARLDAVEGRAGLKTELQVDINERLPGIVEDGFYRIAQEALNNVLKHAHARHVRLSLKVTGKSASLEIYDDGVGFLLQKGLEKGGIGIRSMYERAERMGGKMTITSTRRKGTRVFVEARL